MTHDFVELLVGGSERGVEIRKNVQGLIERLRHALVDELEVRDKLEGHQANTEVSERL